MATLGLQYRYATRTMRLVVASLLAMGALGQVCPDTTATHHYPLPSTTYTAGLPADAVRLPASLTECELNDLQAYCVSAINVYRTATVKFSDGRSPPFSAKAPLGNPNTPLLQCLNEKAMSDLIYAKSGQGCGHYTSSLDCGLGTGGGAENSCCPRFCDSFETCKAKLDGCLKQMYDEGEIVLNTGSNDWTMATGHYWNMISDSKHVVCGFGFDKNGGMLATQNFYSDRVSATPCEYACGTANSPDDECGNCVGVTYCSSDSDCNTPPTCYQPTGICTNGVCAYNNLATTCTAGTCTAQGQCVQNCADANCDVCSSGGAGGCTQCKAGFDIVNGCCKSSSCVIARGAKYSTLNGEYNVVGEYNDLPAYTNGQYFLVSYCCDWGWSFTTTATGGAAYQRSDFVTGVTGTAVESSGQWSTGGVTIEHCEATCSGLAPSGAVAQDCDGTWSQCDASCRRTFTQNQAQQGGEACPSEPPCYFGDNSCGLPKDCLMSWSDCDAQCQRTGQQTQAQQGTGNACPSMPVCQPGQGTCPQAETQAAPSDAVLHGKCGEKFEDCSGTCWKWKAVKAALGNGKCGDYAQYGLNLNCEPLGCDAGDCGSNCPPKMAGSNDGLPAPEAAFETLIGAMNATTPKDEDTTTPKDETTSSAGHVAGSTIQLLVTLAVSFSFL